MSTNGRSLPISYRYLLLSMRSAGGAVPDGLSRLLELLRKMEQKGQGFDGIYLNHNPWAEPPEAVVESGMTAVLTYFDALYSAPFSVRRNSVKVVLVGQEGAGKTR